MAFRTEVGNVLYYIKYQKKTQKVELSVYDLQARIPIIRLQEIPEMLKIRTEDKDQSYIYFLFGAQLKPRELHLPIYGWRQMR
jgi:hypothetical protein